MKINESNKAPQRSPSLLANEAKWKTIFKKDMGHSLSVDIPRVGIDPYLDNGTLMCLTCDKVGNAEIVVDEVIESSIAFKTLPIYTGTAYGMWFNTNQMKALRSVLDTIIENSEGETNG